MRNTLAQRLLALVLGSALLAPLTAAGGTTSATTTAPTRHMKLEGQTIAYRVVGARSGVPLLLLNRFRGTMDHWDPELIDRIAAKLGVELELAVETNTLEMARGVVRNGDLVTLMPRYAALHEVSNGDLCAVPLKERDFAQTATSLVTLPTQRLSPAARSLLELLATAMGRYGGKAGGRSDFGNMRMPESAFSPAQPLPRVAADLEEPNGSSS